jgi:hypothetical protein
MIGMAKARTRATAFACDGLALACALLVAGCGEGDKPAPKQDIQDPSLTAALADPIMVDADLVGQNQGFAAIVAAGPLVIESPLLDRSPEAIAVAKADAVRLAGGAIKPAPEPAQGNTADAAILNAVTAGQLAKAANAACADQAEYTMRWAALLPEALSIYPRGAVEEAAGSDADGCVLRVVKFATPADIGDVLGFYHTRAASAGYAVRHSVHDRAHILWGAKGRAAYLLRVRPRDDGLTEVDLVVSGG